MLVSELAGFAGGVFSAAWENALWCEGWIREEHRSDTVFYYPTHWMPVPPPPGAEVTISNEAGSTDVSLNQNLPERADKDQVKP